MGSTLLTSPAFATLLGVDSALEFLAEVDPTTGSTTRLSPDFSVGTDGVALTYDASTNTIFGIGFLGTVISLDRSTGVGTVLSSAPLGGVSDAVHFDPNSGSLFAVDSFLDDQLVQVDPSTGAVTPVGLIGFESVNTLAGHADGNVYAVSNLSNELLAIDLATGAGTAVATLSEASNFIALSYLPSTDQLLGLLEFGTLVEVDVASGAVTTIAATGLDALVVVPEPGTALLIGFGLALLASDRRGR